MDRVLKGLRPGNWKLAAALSLSVLLHVFAALQPLPGLAGTGLGPVAKPLLKVQLPGATWQAQADGVLPSPGGTSTAPALSGGADPGEAKGETAAGGSLANYMDARYLTVQPYPLEDVDVPFPPGIAPQDGKMVVELLIEPDGRAAKVTPIHSELPEEYGRQVVQAFSDKRYAAGKLRERKVSSRLLVEVVFDTSGLF